MSVRVLGWVLLSGTLVACGPANRPAVAGSQHGVSRPQPRAPEELLRSAEKRLASADYAGAEREFRLALGAREPARAELGLAEVQLATGRYAEAAQTAQKITGNDEVRAAAAVLQAEALRRQGQLEPAEAALRAVEKLAPARRARLLLGEVLLERGKRQQAEPLLMSLIDDYNADRIAENDGTSLAMVGRAAYLLRSAHDANDAFDEAERAMPGHVQTLLWRAELFLEKYDPGHAEEVTAEVLEHAPNHPEANVWMAHVRLAQALDFDEAERLAKKALAVNPKLAGAHFVLAGIALRDVEIALADQHIDAGLAHNPRDLDLLSLRATARFLADDQAGFEKSKQTVLAQNPEFTRMYQIIGEYADWEHRYDEIVAMMREAVKIDADDAKALAQLGLNLIRAGDDTQALPALQSAFDKDPFNVRVYNTLNLYEKVIPKDYVDALHAPFKIRYHKSEKPVLDRYVPELLKNAWKKMVQSYAFTPQTPVGIELYAERQNFAVRTSGLPQTAIQGVCFGRTLAAMSPKEENFNVGMTLWHELAHVFHIQRSRSRVPRWFTEGLAEYETIVERPEWAREHDPDLYEALRAGRLPKIGAMSRAFTRAEELNDVATAYYASSQILVMMADRYGRPKLSRMLELWGEGKTTADVIMTALGVTSDQLDQEFRKFLDQRLARYRSQFVPRTRVGALAKTAEDAKAFPKHAEKLTAYAIALLRAGKPKRAESVVAQALAIDPKLADARFVKVELLQSKRDAKQAGVLLRQLVADGHDGYAVQMALASVAQASSDVAQAKAALEAARRFDPTQSDPVQKLALLAAHSGDKNAELELLRKLAELEQHDPRVYKRLLTLLVEKKAFAEARTVGEAAIYADLEGLETHVLFAQALSETGQLPRAVFELESALLCPGEPREYAEVHIRLAELQLKSKNRARATHHAREAQRLDPNNPKLGTLKL